MGSAQSRPKRAVVLTLDALGTLYRLREPVAVQYFNVAKTCGLQPKYDVDELAERFRREFKTLSMVEPNYGKASGMTVESWWTRLIQATFNQDLNDNFTSTLYRHFQTKAAYELYPDVEPLLSVVRSLKNKFSASADSAILTGVITNSDSRVKSVLQDFGLSVGPSALSKASLLSAAKASVLSAASNFSTASALSGPDNQLFHRLYASYDFNFLSTSYEKGYEKPHAGILDIPLVQSICMARAYQITEKSILDGKSFRILNLSSYSDMRHYIWVHVGDDRAKDGGLGKELDFVKTIHLQRNSNVALQEGSVESLEDVAGIFSVIANQNLRKP